MADKEAHKRSSLKYTDPRQRSAECAKRPREHARAPVTRSFLMLARCPPVAFAQNLVEDGLLENLKGMQCVKTRCNTPESVLGRMVGVRQLDLSQEQVVCDIFEATVCYRCGQCRKRYSVIYGHKLFTKCAGHGGWSISRMALAWLGWCEDKTVTQVARDIEVHPDTVAKWFDIAMLITTEDVLARQRSMVFGGRETTTDVEVLSTKSLKCNLLHLPRLPPCHTFPDPPSP